MNTNTKFSKKSPRLLGAGLMVMALLAVATPSFASADVLTRQLEVGSRGSDVGSLQTFLAQDPTLYPQGLVTNYFGFLTKSAVANFQSRNNLPAVGRVGPMTLPVLNAQMALGMSNGASASISNVTIVASSSNATVNWTTNEAAKGVVYYSNTPLTTFERENSVDVSGNTAMTDTSLRTSQSVAISGLSSNTTYYYLVYTTDQTGNVSVTWPSTFKTN